LAASTAGVRSDPARLAAYRTLRAVSADDAYANLVLPRQLAAAGLTGRDAGLATELGYGSLRALGVLDEVLRRCSSRELPDIDPAVLDLLRLGAYQLLKTRIPTHAAVATTVDLSRSTGNGRAAGFVNAVLRRVAARDFDGWCAVIAAGASPLGRLAVRYSHPGWIVGAFAEALAVEADQVHGAEVLAVEADQVHGAEVLAVEDEATAVAGDGADEAAAGEPSDAIDLAELARALAADDTRPETHLVGWPGLIDRAELASQAAGSPGPYSPYAVRLTAGGEPGSLPAIRSGQAAVQDEGSQLCALALLRLPLTEPDAGGQDATGPDASGADATGADATGADATGPEAGSQDATGPSERWLDLCAGPGGKAALLAAQAGSRGARLTANELHPHRAELVAAATRHWPVELLVGDARELTGSYDRVLLDAPCTGLGALRRRPEARWRRSPADLAELTELQADLLDAAVRLLRPGGVLAYVTCSPHLAETRQQVDRALTRHPELELLDARPAFPSVDRLTGSPMVQLWPHRHGTDAMFFAGLRRRGV
jgi:16S rRNA (cytosine967-C5)-methyltransferase